MSEQHDPHGEPVEFHAEGEYVRHPNYRLRRATVGLIVVLVEVTQIPLFAKLFGEEIVALLSVRMVLTMIVAAFFVRNASNFARILLAAIRGLAFAVAIVMGIDAAAWTLVATAVVDGGAVAGLAWGRFFPPAGDDSA